MIRALLWDLDGTLLNFKAAEAAAIRSLFKDFGFGPCTDEMIRTYARINDAYWKKLERGEMAKPEILVRRFADFFAGEGLDPAQALAFNQRYQLALGDTIVFCDEGDCIVQDLKGRIPQYGVTNGTLAAQTKKLERSGLGALFDGVFISDQIGYEKPDVRFFTPVFAQLAEDVPGITKEEILIIGDSLTSDMLGGIRAGIRTCWYHPVEEQGAATAGQDEAHQMAIDHEIRDLHEIYGILGMNQK